MIFTIRKNNLVCAWIIIAHFALFAKKESMGDSQTKTVSGPVEVCGFGQFKNKIFDQRMNAYGTIELSEVTLKKPFTVNGSAFVKKSIFKEMVDSNGLMEAENATFESTITFEGKLVLKNSKASDIIISKYTK